MAFYFIKYWLSDQYIKEAIRSFMKEFHQTLAYWRKEYDLLLREYDDLVAKERNEKYFAPEHSRLSSIAHKLEEMRVGVKEYYSYRYLSSRGFLPNYGFPSSSMTLSFYDSSDEIVRNESIALSEFASGNILYYRGNTYRINYARPRKEKRKPVVESLIVCNNCSTVIVGEKAKIVAACECCSHTLVGSHPRNAMRIPDMLATKINRITSDEEERRRLGYDITLHYQMGERIDRYTVFGNDETFELRYEHNGRLVHLNNGTKRNEDDGQENGFTLCIACNKWLFGEDSIEDHINPDKRKRTCPKNATEENILRKLILFTDGTHDIITIHIPKIKDLSQETYRDFLITLKEALVRGIEIALNLDDGEISGFVSNIESEEGKMDIVIFETAEGGVGSLSSLLNKNRFEQIIFTTLELLHDKDNNKGCLKACYECLLNFYNQKEHENYNRNIILSFLKQFTEVIIKEESNDKKDLILETLLQKCKSSFEKEILYKIAKRNVPLPNESQKIIYDGGAPIAEADFYYSDRNLILLIDGEPHQYDYVSKGDELKRRKLKNLGYRVHSINYAHIEEDLEKFIALLD